MYLIIEIKIKTIYIKQKIQKKFERSIVDVSKVSSRFAFFGEIFAYRLVPKKILVVPDRVSNTLSNAYLSKKFYCDKRLKNSKNSFYITVFSKQISISA